MLNHEIEELIAESGVPCISVIIPTHHVSPERKLDMKVVTKAVKYAKEIIMQKYRNEANTTKLIKNIELLVDQIDYTHSKEGIGLYVSPNTAKLVKFPFPVIEKIKADTVFDRRDLLYYSNTIIDYCILSISKKHIQLFNAKGEEIIELKNEDFPIDYKETYEYEKSSRGTSFGNSAFKDFERDKSVMEEIRLTDLLRKADQLLTKYVNDHIPLIISGGKKEVRDFLKITSQKKRVIGKVIGNYNFNGDTRLAALSWQQVEAYQKKQNDTHLLNLYELVGKDQLAVGIEEVWKAAKEGKGLELLVEKDFEHHGFVSANGFEMREHELVGENEYIFTGDIVEKLIRTVKEKKGKVIFMENGTLKDFNGVALHLRYTTPHN